MPCFFNLRVVPAAPWNCGTSDSICSQTSRSNFTHPHCENTQVSLREAITEDGDDDITARIAAGRLAGLLP